MTELYVAMATTRRFTSRAPELRDVGGAKHIAGYASVFNKISRNLGGFVEQIDRRAFDESLIAGWPDVVCRYNHDDNYLLGTTRAGTLDLRRDETGLYYDVVPPSFRSDIIELCARGDVTQSSFAFRVPDQGDYWERSGPGGMPLRTVVNTELVDVAPVNTPAYSDATASARSWDDDLLVSLARYSQSEVSEVRSYLSDSGTVAKFFKRSDRPAAPKQEEAKMPQHESDEERAKLSGASMNDLPDSAFAYIEDGGEKDADGKTTPRSKRHFPIHDEAHVRNALSRAPQSPFGPKAMPKIKAAAKKFGIKVEEQNALVDAAYAEMREALMETDEERAAKANYADLETCGNCGATGQYGKFCAGCGTGMQDSAPAGKFCTSCGGKLQGKRSEHSCDDEYREAEERGDLPPWLQKPAKGDAKDDKDSDDDDEKLGSDKKKPKKKSKTEKKSEDEESEERAEDEDAEEAEAEESEEEAVPADEEVARAAAEREEMEDRLRRNFDPYAYLDEED